MFIIYKEVCLITMKDSVLITPDVNLSITCKHPGLRSRQIIFRLRLRLLIFFQPAPAPAPQFFFQAAPAPAPAPRGQKQPAPTGSGSGSLALSSIYKKKSGILLNIFLIIFLMKKFKRSHMVINEKNKDNFQYLLNY